MHKKFIALIPLRGGSKGIPKKNIKIIGGKPLCNWSIEAALASNIFERVIVSTDSEEIKNILSEFGNQITIMDRPSELATDESSTESVMLHIAEKIDFDVMCLIQATSPLTTKENLSEAIRKFDTEGYDSLFTGVETHRFYWDKNAVPLNYDYKNRPRRQEFDGSVVENGAFYLTKKNLLLKEKNRLGGKMGVYLMPPETELEIDSLEDWKKMETIISHSEEKINVPQIMIFDVDGTLTDGGMYYSASGEELKKFNTRDAVGLELIRKLGVDVRIMTSEDSAIVKARAKKLQIEKVYLGIKNKLELVKKISKQENISLENIGFMGDDINDLDVIKSVGFSGCPSDSNEDIYQCSNFNSNFKGGQGAVRELCNYLVKSIKNNENSGSKS